MKVGVDKRDLGPLPLIPSHRGRGGFWGFMLEMLEENSQIEPCKILNKPKIHRLFWVLSLFRV
jgi:hypothetical protein